MKIKLENLFKYQLVKFLISKSKNKHGQRPTKSYDYITSVLEGSMNEGLECVDVSHGVGRVSGERKPGVDYLFLDFNSYFASCEQQMNPKLRGRPLAVVPMLTDHTCCIAASYEAKAFGVKTGTMVSEARRLCPEIVFIAGHHENYIRYHHRLVECVESVLPVEDVHSIDELSCRLMGSQRAVERASALAATIKAKISSEVGEALTCSIGLGPNRLLAKVAADMKKPNGLTVVLPSELPHKFYSLKLDDFPGIGRSMLRRLYRAGVYDVPTLYKLSPREMRQVWGGVVGERFWHLLRGEELELPPSRTHSLSHQHVLPPEERYHEGAYRVAAKLTAKAALRLRKKGYFARQFFLVVKFLDREKFYGSDSFHETSDTRVFLESLSKLWSGFHREIRPVKVVIVLADLVSAEAHQLSLFENPRDESLSKAIDRINEKFGRETLSWGILKGTERSAPTRISFQNIPEL